MQARIIIDSHLSIPEFVSVARGRIPAGLSESARKRIDKSRKELEKTADKNIVYGVNTGFGFFQNKVIRAEQREELQMNLVRSHAAAVGRPLSEEVVAGIILHKILTFSQGLSGVTPELVEHLINMLNRNIIPVIPEQGSLGASGDLAPLAHLALAVIGEGDVVLDGRIMNAGTAFKKTRMKAYSLKMKEGLSLINSTSLMASVSALTLYDSINLLNSAECSAALSMEALNANISAFDESIQKIKRNDGQIKTARIIRDLTRGSRLIANNAHQDAYSLRCIPQVHGAVRTALGHIAGIAENELNAVTDNPVIINNRVISGGNFHGQSIAMAMDYLAIVLTALASISERRTARMLDPALSSGLPAFLVRKEEAGLRSGLMIAHYTAASLVSENKVLSHPASVDSIPTSAGQEDHVSMGATAARKAYAIMENARRVIAVELICACQAMEFRDRNLMAEKTKKMYWIVRKKVKKLDTDRPISKDIEGVADLIKSDAFSQILPRFHR